MGTTAAPQIETAALMQSILLCVREPSARRAQGKLLRWIRGTPKVVRMPVVVLTGSGRRSDYEIAAQKSLECTEKVLAFVRRPSEKLLPC